MIRPFAVTYVGGALKAVVVSASWLLVAVNEQQVDESLDSTEC